MDVRLIIDGNAVYELDEDCVKRRKDGKEDCRKERQDENAAAEGRHR